MTDAQMMTLAFAVIFPLGMLLYSNSRITDVRHSVEDAKETLRAEIKASNAEIMASIERIAAQIAALDAKFEARIKLHELEYHK